MRTARREKVFGPGRAVPLDRNAKARIMAYARAWGARHRQPGQHKGPITRTFLEVLEALLWGFHNARSSCPGGSGGPPAPTTPFNIWSMEGAAGKPHIAASVSWPWDWFPSQAVPFEPLPVPVAHVERHRHRCDKLFFM